MSYGEDIDCWHEAEAIDGPDSVYTRVFQHVKALELDQIGIHYQNLLHHRLYTNRDLTAYEWQGASQISFQPISMTSENVIASVMETVIALVGKNRPKASTVARAADFDVYLRARQLDRWLWGEFISQDVWNKGNLVFEDGALYGTGLLKHDIDGDEIYTEVVNPDEIIVDQRECVSCREPQQMHQRKLYSRMFLLNTYGKGKSAEKQALRQKILDAPASDFMQYSGKRSRNDDQVLVIESWKLGPDGRHTICIETACLLDEGYDRTWFPFTDFVWNPPKSGWYGRSLVEGLIPYQIRLNKLNRDIEMGQHIMCTPQIWMQQGNGIIASQLDDTIGRIIKTRGEPPEPKVWNAFSPEIYQERDRTRASAFEFAGVSQLSAQAKLPTQARLDSSEALREFNAIENERFARQAQAYEDFYIRVGRRLIELGAELYKNQSVDREHTYRSKYLIKQIKWSEVDLEAEKYVLQISASSILNMSPAARKDKLNEWAAAGVITQQEYKAWSGEPDLERMADLMAAPNDYAEYVVDELLEGEPVTPDPLSDLNLLLRVTHDTYLHLRALEAPEDILQNFRDFLMLVEGLLNPPADPTLPTGEMGAGAMMGGAPGVMPDATGQAMMGPPPMDPMMGGMPGDMTAVTAPNPINGAPVPAISMPAANAFVG
jgi:hypothetical protein